MSMLDILTSYYSSPLLKDIINGRKYYRLVSISRGIPDNFNGETYIQLAPTWDIIKLKNNPEEYKIRYNEEILSVLDPFKVMEDLKYSILLCYEKPNNFCHRRLVADWLEKNIEVKVPELNLKLKKYILMM